MIYQWKDGAHSNGIKAEVAGKRLEKIRNKNGGRITPHAVVNDARPEDSPLHPAFEWDDTRAAEEHRLEQARCLIRSVTVIYDEKADKSPVRAFVNVVQGSDTDATYTSMAHALSVPELREQVIRRALSEIKSWRQRYEDYKELGTIFDAIDKTAASAAA